MTGQSAQVGAPAPHRARGVLDAQSEGSIVMRIPGTDYQLRLGVYKPVAVEIGKRLVGTIRATARKIDSVGSGGEYIEPVYGEPRRIQGSVLAIDGADQTIVVKACVPISVKVGAGQRADQFEAGQMVAFDVQSGTYFLPA